jgi:hypothetical protein
MNSSSINQPYFFLSYLVADESSFSGRNIMLIWFVRQTSRIHACSRYFHIRQKDDDIHYIKQTSICVVKRFQHVHKKTTYPFSNETSNVQKRSLLHLCFLRSTGTRISCCSRNLFLHLRFFWEWQAVDLSGVCGLLSATGGSGGSGGSTTLGTHSLAPIADISILYLWRMSEASNLHEGSGEEGNTNHQSPAGHDGETVDDPTKGNGKTSLSKHTIERVEEALIGSVLLESLVGNNLDKVLSGDSGAVECR